MKADKNILIAFILNIAFSIFELVGGMVTGSIALISDAVHDFGDGVSIGISWLLEEKSNQKPDEVFTYGYRRYSVVGSALTSMLLLLGAVFVVCNAVGRMIEPKEINYNAMIPLAVVGVCVNFAAAYVTHGGCSLNLKAVNLHMLEDVFGWLVVLLGAIVMKVTDFALLDPILSVGISVFIFIHAWKHLMESLHVFLEKVPDGLELREIKESLLAVEGVTDVSDLHIWTLDGEHHAAAVRITANGKINERVRETLHQYGIEEVTVEIDG